MRSSEGTHSVQVVVPQDISVDVDSSEYDSRPNSELKDSESRPRSTDRMSRTSSNENLYAIPGNRSYSIDETVSDCLKVSEPFVRPKSPMPQHSFEQGADEKKLKVSLSAPPASASKQSLQSTDSIEAEMTFSHHFTQVFDDEEEIKQSQNKFHTMDTESKDLTPESQMTSDSMETSQGEEYFIQPDMKPRAVHDLEDRDDLLVGSPPMVSRPLGVKYWPPIDNLDQDLDHDSLGPVDKRSITRSESDDNSVESRTEVIDNEVVEKDVEDGKRWLENQFDNNQHDDYGQYGYGQPLDQILEEEEDRYSHSSEDVKELQRFKESLSSTPDFDQIINKRSHFSRSGEQDDLSMGSLTEFERLEREVGLESVSGSGSHGSLGSNDSLEVEKSDKNGQKSHLQIRVINSKSGTGDDVSVSSYNSLKSFELMEAACKEAEQIERKAKQQEEVLSEIEEGHESQDSESAETISECEEERSEKDYEDRLFEIDSIIKQAQANVEKFDKDKKPTDEISLRDIMGRPESKTESVASNDSLENAKVPDLPRENIGEIMQASVDSLDDQVVKLPRTTSTDSLEGARRKPESSTMITSLDSLEGTPRRHENNMMISTDSIEGTAKDVMITSLDSLDGGEASKKGQPEKKKEFLGDMDEAAGNLFTSTDSLESSSTNTRATASMLSSYTSQGSETLVADDEFEHDDEDSRSARKFLIDQGKLQIDDSDDSSATYSYSSPQTTHKVLKKSVASDGHFAVSGNMASSAEEILETEEIDDKGNRISKKIIQRRIHQDFSRTSDKKYEGYNSGELSEKKDDSCEETIEEVDEFGERKRYVVKRTIEQESSGLMKIVEERRNQQGFSPGGEMFKSTTWSEKEESAASSPPAASFRSQIPIRKQK